MIDQKIDREILADEFSQELQRIIDFWKDEVVLKASSGFFGQIEMDGTVIAEADKGGILCSRILWFLSEAALFTGDSKVVQAADQIYDYVIRYFLDEENGGFYWSVASDSSKSSGRKQAFAQAFFVYALCAYYHLKKDDDVLGRAKNLWRLLEEKTAGSATGCHFAAFDENWVPLENMGLDDINAPHTLDTELHIMEAYTALYSIEPNEKLEKNLRKCLDVFDQYFIDHKTRTFHTHLDREGQSISKVVLYGHNVECAWLIWNTVEAIADKALSEYWKPIVLSLVKRAVTDGLSDSGKLLEGYELSSHKQMTGSVWWVQAEALMAFLVAEELDADAGYIECFISIWDYLKKQHIDKNYGEWLGNSRDEMTRGINGSLVNEWKGPYHNGRVLLRAFHYFSGTSH